MKHADVINQIRNVLPKHTSRFNSSLNVSSVIATSTTSITVVTSTPHGLITGAAISCQGFDFENVITAVSQDGLVFTFETTEDHDLTEQYHETIKIQGFTDVAWNGEFDLLAVPNRKTFTLQSTNTLPTPDADSALLEPIASGPRGVYGVTVVDTTTFTISGNFNVGNYFNGSIASGVRIYGAVNIKEGIKEYTQQQLTDYWICVCMHDSDISKSLDTDSSASAVLQTNATLRMKLIDTFTVFVIVNASDQAAGVVSSDVCRGELLAPMLKSILGVKFDTNLAQSAQYKTSFLGHGMAQYNGAVYTHYYGFESISEVTNSDAVNQDDSVAFRNVGLIEHVDAPTISDDVETMTANIDLDDDPIIP